MTSISSHFSILELNAKHPFVESKVDRLSLGDDGRNLPEEKEIGGVSDLDDSDDFDESEVCDSVGDADVGDRDEVDDKVEFDRWEVTDDGVTLDEEKEEEEVRDTDFSIFSRDFLSLCRFVTPFRS